MKTINLKFLFVIFSITYIFLQNTSCSVSNDSEIFYKEVNSEGLFILHKEFRDFGALGESFEGYALSYKNNFKSIPISDYKFIDTTYWSNDSLYFILNEQHSDGGFLDTNYIFRIGNKKVFIYQVLK